MTIYTIGHSTRTLDEFVAALKAAGVDCVADIRRFPRSRRYPHFNDETLGPALAKVGILYRHFPALGGRRNNRADGKPSPHLLWREPARLTPGAEMRPDGSVLYAGAEPLLL